MQGLGFVGEKKQSELSNKSVAGSPKSSAASSHGLVAEIEHMTFSIEDMQHTVRDLQEKLQPLMSRTMIDSIAMNMPQEDIQHPDNSSSFTMKMSELSHRLNILNLSICQIKEAVML